MKTIEERANQYAIETIEANNNERYDIVFAEFVAKVEKTAYIKGATEQREIDHEEFHPIMEENVLKAINKQKELDIQKACDVYRNELQEVLDLFTKYGERKGIKQLGDIISIGGSVSDFRKAMEGGEK